MTKRPALFLFTLPLLALLLTAACTAQNDAAPAAATPAAATTAATTEAQAPAAEASTADAAAAAATQAAAAEAMAASAASAAETGPAPVAGTDYVEIPGGQPFDPLNGKIEVVEVFGYVCPACANLQPLISAWKAKLPADVRFTYVPAMFGGMWDDYARAFYTSESMGLTGNTHDALYKAIHIEQTLKGERGRDSVQDIANFYGSYGVDPKQFASTMASFAVAGKTSKAKQFALRSNIGGTPSLIVNGKYLVKGTSYEDMLRIAAQLIAQERAAPERAAQP